MDLDKPKKRNSEVVLGYVIMYLIFTTILYFILNLLNKLPETWTYLHIMTITLTIILIAKLTKGFLK